MKKGSRLFTAIIVVVMVLISCLPAFATVLNKQIVLPANQLWTTGYGDNHDPRYSTIGARCESVYTGTGFDWFTKVQYSADYLDGASWVTVTTAPYAVLNEGATNFTPMSIREGYLDIEHVWFKFRGNIDSSAYAVVSYNGSYH